MGLDAGHTGLVMSVGPLVAAITGLPAGRAADRFGTRATSIVGLITMMIGTSLLALLPGGLGIPAYIGPMVFLTAGYALYQTANNTAVLTGVSAKERGAISGLLNLSRNLGLVSGASVLGAVFALGVEAADPRATVPAAASLGLRITFAVASMLVLLALAVATGARGRPRAPFVRPRDDVPLKS